MVTLLCVVIQLNDTRCPCWCCSVGELDWRAVHGNINCQLYGLVPIDPLSGHKGARGPVCKTTNYFLTSLMRVGKVV